MRVLVAPCSYKGTLSSVEAASVIARALRASDDALWVDEAPMADGGEGTLDVLIAAMSGVIENAVVPGPLGRPTRARYARTYDGTLIVESAEACGLSLVAATERDVLHASTFGVGQLVDAALRAAPDAQRLLLTLGGSATADGGYGFLRALGATSTFIEPSGAAGDGPRTPDALDRLAELDVGPARERLRAVELRVLCDVRSPLLGDDGARRYFKQKGADASAEAQAHMRLERLVAAVRSVDGSALAQREGAGAAGGLGFAAAACGGHLVQGAPFVASTLDLRGRIEAADVVLTGEGALDGSTFAGKAPSVVLAMALAARKRIVFLAGHDGRDEASRYASSDLEVLSLAEGPLDATAMAQAQTRLADAALHAIARVRQSLD